MEALVRRIVNRMSYLELINEQEKEYCQYFLELTLEKIFALGMIFIMAFCMNRVLEMLLFFVTFSSIRKYAGGYHCRTFYGCFLLSVGVCFVCAGPLSDGMRTSPQLVQILVTLICVGVILVLGAINHPDMSWDAGELRRAKNTARSMAVVLGGAVVSFHCLGIVPQYAFYMAEGIWVSAFSMLVAKLLGQEVACSPAE